MRRISIAPTQSQRKVRWQPVAFIVGLLLLAALSLWASAGRDNQATERSVTGLTSVEFEEKTGLRLTLVGVTAAGGLVDVRLKVLDPQKAAFFLQDGQRLPVLLPENRSMVITLPENSASPLELQKDRMVFFLFPNTRGAIKSGDRVALEIGDARLEGLIAK